MAGRADVIRVGRVLAIARYDLNAELRGRGGWIVPGILFTLLAPIAAVPAPRPLPEPTVFDVSGAAPDSVRNHPGLRVTDRAPTRLVTSPEGLTVRGPIPAPLRQALDGPEPALVVQRVPTQGRWPGRTMALGLVAASSLTGSVAASIAGERTHRTLVALLTSAVSRLEVVLGKWVAWGGLGMTAAMAAALGTVLGGHAEVGTWIVALPWVPLGTAAGGLFVVRRATDVVGGTATALRVLPSGLSFLGLIAWWLGRFDPILGALVPIGGALVASGATWDSPTADLLASFTAAIATFGLLAITARDLEESPADEPAPQRPWAPLALISATALAPVLGPLGWAAAGNAKLTDQLNAMSGQLAAASGTLLAALVWAARDPRPAPPVDLRAFAAAVPAGVALALLSTVLSPGGHGMPLPAVLAVWAADEFVFRGVVARRAGPLVAGITWCVVRQPFAMLESAPVALALGLLAAKGGWKASLLAVGVALGISALRG